MIPTSRSAAELLPLLPELTLVGGAFALLMLDLFLNERQRAVTHVLAIAVLVAATLMTAFGVGGDGVVLTGMFVRDTAADVVKVAVGATAALSMVYLWPFLRERGLYKGEIAVLVLFAVAGMFLLASANSLVMVYLGLEMLALCSYALVAIDRDSPLASEAAIKYFVLGSLASGLLLYGLSLIYGATGSLDLATVANAAAAQPSAMLVTGVVFAVAGIAFKFGAAPFHMWLPDVYHGAPTPVTLFIGSAPKLATFAMAYRVLEVAAGPLDDDWRMLLASANSLVMVYLGLEMLALCSYALVAIDRDSPLASEAAIKYFVLGSLASGLLLYGLSLIYGATGSLDLATVANAAAAQPSAMLVTGVVFAVAGIAFKFGAAPFHMWLPDVYHGAPTPVTLFIGSAPKLATFAMAYRVLEVAAGPLDDDWRMLLAWLAVASLAIGNLGALVQGNFKRLLAYSTVSHVGFLFLGFAGGGAQGFAAALFYAVSYALMSVAAFGVIVVLANRGFEADEIADYKGLNARNPWMAAMVLCVMASLAGLPPFLGFWAKLAVIRAALEGGMLWLALVGVVFAAVGAHYYLRIVKAMYFDEPEGQAQPASSHRPLRVVFGINALALLGLGLAWNPIWAWCVRAFG